MTTLTIRSPPTSRLTSPLTSPILSPIKDNKRLSGMMKKVVRRVSSGAKLISNGPKRRATSPDAHVPHFQPLPPLSPASHHTRTDSQATAVDPSFKEFVHVLDAPKIVGKEIVQEPLEMDPSSEDRRLEDSGGGSATAAEVVVDDDKLIKDAPAAAEVAEPESAAQELPAAASDAPSAPQTEEAAETIAAPPEASRDVEAPAKAEEPEVPDPFIVDEPSPEREVAAPQLAPSTSEAVSADVSLSTTPAAQSPAPEPPAPLSPAPVGVNKSVPPTPIAESDSSSEDEAPEAYITFSPPMFLPIPNTDPLSALLLKYIPPEKRPQRDVTGDWQRSDFHTLVMTNSWRALARMARDRIVSLDPENVPLALSLWSLRLTSLARLRLFNQAAAECTNLFTVLDALPSPMREYVFSTLLPFELEVFRTRLKYWAGDHMGYLDALSALLVRCKTEARQAARTKRRRRKGTPNPDEDVAMWKERGARVCLIIASQLAEMKDFTAATVLLESLLAQPFPTETSAPALRSAIGRIYLQAGNLGAARTHFAAVAADPQADPAAVRVNTALLASADGQWERAEEELRAVLQKDDAHYPAVNNLAVALLAQGKITEAIQLLEDAFEDAPNRLSSAEPFLFNLSTLYELCSVTSADKKRALLVQVAKWSGDGLRATCLKMTTN